MTDASAYYLPPPVTCETLAAMVARFGGSMRMGPKVDAFESDGPIEATAEVRAFLRKQEMALQPTEAVASLLGGRVFGAGTVLAPDGASIARDVSLDFGRPDHVHWLLNDKKIRSPLMLAGKTAVVASALGEGYCHWLLDELPRLLLLKNANDVTTLIAHTGESYAREALALQGWTGAVIDPVRRGHWQCEELMVPTLTGWTGRATSRQIQLVTEFTLPLQSPDSVTGERIYISRAAARRRRVTNEAEVATTLKAHSFTEVRLEELNWREQISVFRQAKLIVAPHGAGLANLIFCQRGTRVIELFSRSYLNGCFWQLAALRGLDYFPLVPPGREAPGCNPKDNRLDLTVDLQQLRAALA
jgi:capsular polysaccharide biosynthesis protein